MTLVDGNGSLLAVPATPMPQACRPGDFEAYRVALEDRLRAKLVQLLERSVGAWQGRCRRQRRSRLRRVATTAEQFDPQSQVGAAPRPPRRTAISRKPSPPTASAPPATCRPSGPQPQTGPGSSEKSNKSEETVNYEISRTVRNQTKRGASIRRLSIAVQVDGIYRRAA